MNEEIVLRSIYQYIETPIFILYVDPTGEFVFGDLNPAFERSIGLGKQELIGKRPAEISHIPPAAAARLRENCHRCLEAGTPTSYDETLRPSDDSRSFHTVLIPVRGDDGRVDRIVGIAQDTTDYRQVDRELRQSRDLLRAIIEAAPTAIIGLDLDGNVHTVWNRAAEKMLGWCAEEVMGRPLPSVPAEGQREFGVFRNRIRRGESMAGVEVRRLRRDGTPIDYSIYASPLHDADGQIMGNIAVLVDITERKRTEETLRQSEEEKSILNEIANIFLTVPDEAMYEEVLTVVLRVMQSQAGIFGYLDENGNLIAPRLTPEIWHECQVAGKSIVFPADSWGDSLWGRAIREKEIFCSDGPFHTPPGHIPIDHFLTVPIVYGQETIGLVSVANKKGGYTQQDKDLLERIVRNVSPILHARLQRDIQEQRREAAEEALRESEEKYRLLIMNAGEAIFVVQDEVVKFPNPKALAMIGYSAEELAEIPFLSLVHPADRGMVFDGYLRLLEGDRSSEVNPFRIVNKEGGEVWVQLTTAPIVWEKRPGILCFLRNMTEEKRLEVQFMQAQKMEAVGRLAGGVAHDFNNMLVVIVGHAELAMQSVDPSHPLYFELKKIQHAAERSADLTRQLLAFARRQTVAPRVLDLNDTVVGMLNMLRRLIGENIDLTWTPDADLWAIKMDPGQIDQILANLCVNARDAISGVGRISIETANVVVDETYCAQHIEFRPGEYVTLTVSDTGSGMSPEVLGHLFEPFFTTKEVGKGTGLGLATVYGIVKQNEGFINVYSEPGRGTAFRLYFPRHRAQVDKAAAEQTVEVPPGGTETVLMVEDEEAILDLSQRILEQLGYVVLVARTPREAIRVVQEHTGPVHLLITDVVMPEMDGRDLAERLVSIKPELKCLYMSGYTADVIAHQGILDEGVQFIQKPFSIKQLATHVRQALTPPDRA